MQHTATHTAVSTAARPGSNLPGRLLPRDVLPRALADMYSTYAFEAVDRRGAFAYDSVSEWADLSEHIISRALDQITSLTDTSLRTAETSFIGKMRVCWRLKGLGSLVVAKPLAVDDEDQATALRPWLTSLGADYGAMINDGAASDLASWMSQASVKVGKGKGAPYWIPGTDQRGAAALARITRDAHDLDDLWRRVVEAGHAVMPACQTAYARIQAAGKEQPAWVFINGVLRQEGMRWGPKIRKIAAQPFVMNVRWAPVGEVMKRLMRLRTPRNSGDITETVRQARAYKYTIAADLSGYDDSVSLQTLTLYREAVIKPVLDALVRRGLLAATERALLLEIDDATQTMPLLAPPWQYGYGATLVPTSGGISSGERLTSVKGTDINRERINAKAQMLGLRIASTNLGDDTTVSSDDARMPDLWAKHSSWIGFTEEVAPEASFLMKRIPQGYAYLGRMLLSTVNREGNREPANVLQAAAGIRIRHELLHGHPLQHAYRGILADCPSERLRRATALSYAGTADELLIASAISSGHMDAGRIEMVLDEYAAMLGTTADNLATLPSELLTMNRRLQMSWREFTIARDGLTAEMARRYLINTSYTIARSR